MDGINKWMQQVSNTKNNTNEFLVTSYPCHPWGRPRHRWHPHPSCLNSWQRWEWRRCHKPQLTPCADQPIACNIWHWQKQCNTKLKPNWRWHWITNKTLLSKPGYKQVCPEHHAHGWAPQTAALSSKKDQLGWLPQHQEHWLVCQRMTEDLRACWGRPRSQNFWRQLAWQHIVFQNFNEPRKFIFSFRVYSLVCPPDGPLK